MRDVWGRFGKSGCQDLHRVWHDRRRVLRNGAALGQLLGNKGKQASKGTTLCPHYY